MGAGGKDSRRFSLRPPYYQNVVVDGVTAFAYTELHPVEPVVSRGVSYTHHLVCVSGQMGTIGEPSLARPDCGVAFLFYLVRPGQLSFLSPNRKLVLARDRCWVVLEGMAGLPTIGGRLHMVLGCPAQLGELDLVAELQAVVGRALLGGG